MSSPDRTHITLPEETVRGLSHCTCGALPEEAAIASLVEEWMRREHAKEVFAKWAGFIKAEDHPEWDTDEDIYNWVRASRRTW